MKKILNPVLQGGFPLRNEDIVDILQAQLFGIHESYLRSLQFMAPAGGTTFGEGIIVAGLQFTPGSTNSAFGLRNVDSLVFLDGELLRPAVTSTPLNFTAPVFIYSENPITETRLFADGQVKNATAERRFNFYSTAPLDSRQYIRINFADGSPRRVEYLQQSISVAAGEVRQLADLTDFNLSTGLGRNRWQGWALANGSNGTVDMRSRTTLGYDPTKAATPTSNPSTSQENTGAIGNTGGANTVALTQGQLPIVSNNYNSSVATINTPVNITTVQSGTGTNVYGFTGASTLLPNSTANSVVTTPISFGNNEVHENRMPYRVLAYVQKIA